MVEIEIINQKKARIKQKQDIFTFNNMFANIFSELNKDGFNASAYTLDEGTKAERHAITQKGKVDDTIIMFYPIFLDEDSKLTRIDISVYDKKAFDYVKKSVDIHSNKALYNNLEKITINTDF